MQLAWGRGDGQVGTWNTQTGEVKRLHAFSHPVASVAFSADGNRLAMADTTGIIVVVDVRSGQLVGRPDSVPGGTELTFGPDGHYLAGAGPREYVYLWNAETYDLVRRIKASIGLPTSAAFVNGGSELRVAGSAGFDRGFLVHPEDLLDLARSEEPRPLTDEECRRYLKVGCEQ